MNHPEVILLPILMLSDYFLTLLGVVLKEGKYAEHFRQQDYELNPLWQKHVREKKWFNPRHILLTVLVSCLFAWAVEFGELPEPVVQVLLGCLFIPLGAILGRDLCNILIFWNMARRPDEITGQVSLAPPLLLSISAFQFLMAAIPVAIVAIFTLSSFALGGLAGIGGCLVFHCILILRHKKSPPKAAESENKLSDLDGPTM